MASYKNSSSDDDDDVPLLEKSSSYRSSRSSNNNEGSDRLSNTNGPGHHTISHSHSHSHSSTNNTDSSSSLPNHSSLSFAGIPDCCRRAIQKFPYSIDIEALKLLDSDIASRWIQSSLDNAAFAFVSHSIMEHHNNPFPLASPAFRKTQLAKFATLFLCCVSKHLWLASCLRPLLMRCCRVSHTDANGLLGVGQMFVISTEVFQRLIDAGEKVKLEAPSEKSAIAANNRREKKLLDIGAGDGNVTKELARLCTSVTATEVSRSMVWALKRRGYRTFGTHDITTVPRDGGYDYIGLFNVIDRCDRPLTLLKQIRSYMRDSSSRLILATPLPLNPSVEKGKKWMTPEENIKKEGGCCMSFEQNLRHLIREVVEPCGYELLSFTRVPYLSQGDAYKPFYTLDDVVLYLAPTGL